MRNVPYWFRSRISPFNYYHYILYDILTENKIMPIKKTKGGYTTKYNGKTVKHKSKSSAKLRQRQYVKK
jgi:hypothetical protein